MNLTMRITCACLLRPGAVVYKATALTTVELDATKHIQEFTAEGSSAVAARSEVLAMAFHWLKAKHGPGPVTTLVITGRQEAARYFESIGMQVAPGDLLEDGGDLVEPSSLAVVTIGETVHLGTVRRPS